MLKPLNPLLHSELRLAVMSLLVSVGEADFVYLREQTGATAGNLSVQLEKLRKAGYIDIIKSFVGKRPNTSCRLTSEGMQAFEEYVETIKEYLKVKKFCHHFYLYQSAFGQCLYGDGGAGGVGLFEERSVHFVHCGEVIHV